MYMYGNNLHVRNTPPPFFTSKNKAKQTKTNRTNQQTNKTKQTNASNEALNEGKTVCGCSVNNHPFNIVNIFLIVQHSGYEKKVFSPFLNGFA